MRRAADVTYGIPFVVGAILLLSVAAGERRTPLHIVVTLSILLWPGTARVARSAARSAVTMQYVEAARVAGASDWWVATRHVVPSTLPVVAAYTTPTLGALVGIEASLSYLGVGLRAPSVSWGAMIAEGQAHFAQSPHIVLIPAVFVAATVAAFVLLGDAISDALDPFSQESG